MANVCDRCCRLGQTYAGRLCYTCWADNRAKPCAACDRPVRHHGGGLCSRCYYAQRDAVDMKKRALEAGDWAALERAYRIEVYAEQAAAGTEIAFLGRDVLLSEEAFARASQ